MPFTLGFMLLGLWGPRDTLTVTMELLPASQSSDPTRHRYSPSQTCTLLLLGLCSRCYLSLKFPFFLLPNLTHPQHFLFRGALPDLPGRMKLSHLRAPPPSWLTTSLCLLLCSAAIVSCSCICLPHHVSSRLRAAPPPQPPLRPRCSGPEPAAVHVRGQVEGSGGVVEIVALGGLWENRL